MRSLLLIAVLILSGAGDASMLKRAYLNEDALTVHGIKEMEGGEDEIPSVEAREVCGGDGGGISP